MNTFNMVHNHGNDIEMKYLLQNYIERILLEKNKMALYQLYVNFHGQ